MHFNKFIVSFALLGFILASLGSFAAEAASFCVDDLTDGPPVAADCSAICNSTPTCSLRDAIEAANADTIVDDIIFGVDGQITLTGSEGNDDNSSGDLDILNGLTLTGNGVALTIVDGGEIDRVFDVLTPGTQVSLYELTVQNGDLSLPSGGAGIQNQADLSLQNLLIFNNKITAPITSTNQGGGIINFGNLSVDTSTLQSNNAEAGGGLRNTGTALITNSSFVDNVANIVGGGGIENAGSGDLTLVNVTLSGNTTPGFGGGLRNGATAQLFNSTVAQNSANTDNDASGDGGGITVDFGNLSLTLSNTLVADNLVGSIASNPDCFTFGDPILSGGFNLVEDIGNCTGFIGSDIQGQDPRLGALGFNGGPTPTQPLLAGSPAIDAANPAGCLNENGTILTQDQRASVRPVDGLGNGGAAICDIGATEFGADVAVLLADNPDPVEPGFVFSYNLQVSNNGPDIAQNVVLTHTLPPDVAVSSITSVASCQLQGQILTCNLGDLASTKIVAVIVQVFAPDFEGSVQSSATVTSQAGDYNLANNSTSIETGILEDDDSGSGCRLARGAIPGGYGYGFLAMALLSLGIFRFRQFP